MPSSYNLGPHFEKLMDDLIASGRYANKSEILRDGLRLVEEREAKLDDLRQAIQHGIDSGPSLDGEAVIAELEERYAKAVAS